MGLSQGYCADAFEGVRTIFDENFERGYDRGATLSVYADGAPVVDLWGGRSIPDPGLSEAYARNSLQLIFCATKGPSAVCVNSLADQGVLDLDVPVAEYWPEFAQAGKESITTRMVLAHRSGLAVLDEGVCLEDLENTGRLDRIIQRQEPAWPPGSAHGYQILTSGFILDGVVRRASGRSLREIFATEIAEPLGLDAWIGLPAAQRHRLSYVRWSTDRPDKQLLGGLSTGSFDEVMLLARALRDPMSAFNRSMTINGILNSGEFATTPGGMLNHPLLWSAGWAGSGMVANASSLARLYAACITEVDGLRVLSESAVDDATRQQSWGTDMTTVMPTRFGSGFHLHQERAPMLSDASFGHSGMGGTIAFADRRYGISFAYVTNFLRVDELCRHRLVRAITDAVHNIEAG